MKTYGEHRTGARRGATMLVAAILIALLGGLSAAIISLTTGHSREANSSLASMRAYYAAEAGLSEAYLKLAKENDGALGSEDAPIEFAQASYWVTAEEVDLKTYSLVSNGEKNGTRARHELLTRALPNGFFQFALFGDESVHLAANSFVDSFDADKGSYASQYDPLTDHANDYGNIGSNGDIELDSTVDVYGDAHCGPEGVLDDSGPGATVSGSTSPAETEVAMPPIDVPDVPSSGNKIVSGAPQVLASGSHHYGALTVNGGATLKLVGPCVLVVDDLLLKPGASLVLDAALGPVDIYGTGDFELKSNSSLITLTGSAEDIGIWLSGDTEGAPPAAIVFNSNSQYTGTVYAPNAFIDIESNFEIFGAVSAQKVELSSNAEVHFDESLLYDETLPIEYQVLLWRPLGLGPHSSALL